MHAANSGIAVQFWNRCLTLVRWDYRDNKHKFLKLVFERSDKWSHRTSMPLLLEQYLLLLGTWHYIVLWLQKHLDGDWWLWPVDPRSLSFPHLFLLRSDVLWLIWCFTRSCDKGSNVSINPWILVLVKVSHRENSNSYSTRLSFPLAMVNHWLKAVSLHQVTSSLLKGNVPYWRLNITLCCWYEGQLAEPVAKWLWRGQGTSLSICMVSISACQCGHCYLRP